MSNVVSLGPLPDMESDPTQLELYRIVDERMTNSFGIWDMAPWSVIYTSQDARTQGKFLDKVVRSFRYGERDYQITIRPARIDTPDGEIDEYPGEREQYVELAIRKIAAQKARMTIDHKEVVYVQVSLYDIWSELDRTGHTFSYDQIREALAILHRSNVEIMREDSDGSGRTRILSETVFPTLMVDTERVGDEAAQVVVHFNALVTDAIKKLNFRAIDYDMLMALRTVARWVYKKLHHELVYSQVNQNTFTLRGSVIYRNCGMGEYSRFRDALDRVSRGVKELASHEDIIEKVETRTVYDTERGLGRPKKVDIEFDITVAQAFIDDAMRARAAHVARIRTYQELEGEEPRRFIAGSVRKRREARTRLSPVVQEVLPLR